MKQVFLILGLIFFVTGVSWAQDFSERSFPQEQVGEYGTVPAQGALDTRDPFATGVSEMPAPDPGGSAPVSSSAVVLQGIAIGSSGKALAVINGRKYVAGESKNGVEVLEIEKREVRVQVDGQEKVLSMALQFEKSKSEQQTESVPLDSVKSSGNVVPPRPNSSYTNSESSMASSQGGVL